MTWWCSAQGLPWTWRPYPGVWLLVAAVVGLYVWANATLDVGDRVTACEKRFFFLGVREAFFLSRRARPLGCG
jgi:hypothetical protein